MGTGVPAGRSFGPPRMCVAAGQAHRSGLETVLPNHSNLTVAGQPCQTRVARSKHPEGSRFLLADGRSTGLAGDIR